MSNTKVNATEVTRLGDWVIPVDNNGKTVYALQINKTQEEKDNFPTILKEYQDAGVEVLTYSGKGGLPVYLVEASKKLKKTRTGIQRDSMLDAMVASGMTREQASIVLENAKKLAEQKKAEKANS